MGAGNPVFVFGFGRSGTTWVSDILSKCLGKALLFEPFHPCVYENARNDCYAPCPDDRRGSPLRLHYEKVASKQVRNRWLLRNHLHSPLEDVSTEFVEYIWQHIEVGGFKSIRQNFALSWWKNTFDAHIFFVIRHPLAVVSSIFRRPRFFEEFGWEFHWATFVSRTREHFDQPSAIAQLAERCVCIEEKVAFMWCVSNAVALLQLSKMDLAPIHYEALYDDPFSETKKWLSRLGVPRDLHPSYFFTPSMLTLTTSHPFHSRDHLSLLPNLFWAEHLSQSEINGVNRVLEEFMAIDERFGRMVVERDYLYRS